MTSLYRIALPFLGLMFFGLTIIMFVPKLSTIAIEGDIKNERAKAERLNEPPRDAWMLECVQEDRNNPLPCSDEDRKKWGASKDIPSTTPEEPDKAGKAPPETGGSDADDKLLEQLMDEDAAKEKAAPGASGDPAHKQTP